MGKAYEESCSGDSHADGECGGHLAYRYLSKMPAQEI